MRKKPVGRDFSVGQVARMCHVARETIRRWIRNYGLNAYNTSNEFAIKIIESDLRSFAERLNVFVDWGAVEEED